MHNLWVSKIMCSMLHCTTRRSVEGHHRCLTGVPLWLYDDDHSYTIPTQPTKTKNSNGVRGRVQRVRKTKATVPTMGSGNQRQALTISLVRWKFKSALRLQCHRLFLNPLFFVHCLHSWKCAMTESLGSQLNANWNSSKIVCGSQSKVKATRILNLKLIKSHYYFFHKTHPVFIMFTVGPPFLRQLNLPHK